MALAFRSATLALLSGLLIAGCAAPLTMVDRPSPNFGTRDDAQIGILVIHYTGLPTAEAALNMLTDPEAKVSSHYTIDEDGTVYVHVPESSRAWHAGLSYWAGITDVNSHSIGIELVNPGLELGYRKFSEAQIAALIKLCREILARHPISAARIVGHSDVAPDRKDDPGELFPWRRLARAGIGLWPSRRRVGLPAEALAQFGYDPKAAPEKVITAFQRHYRPRKVTGVWDRECGEILASLLQKAGLVRPPRGS